MIVNGSLTLICYALSPVLIVLAYWTWYSVTRLELQAWRNSMGLAAMTVAAVTWLFWITLFFLGLRRIEMAGAFIQLCLSGFVYGGPVAAVLAATALSGRARTFTIAAGILLWAGLQAFSYR